MHVSKAAAIVSAKRLSNHPNRHPLIIIIFELTPRYTEERGRVGVDIMFRELKVAGYISNCAGYADEIFNSTFMEAYEAEHGQWDCIFEKKHQTTG